MAKDITLKDKNGGIKYPKTVTAIVYENGTGKTLQTIIDEMRQVDTQTDTRTQHFKADVNNLDTLKNKTDIGLYNYVGTGWRGSVSVCYDSADNVSQVALSSSTPSYNGNTLTWLSAQPCAMARTYTNGAWSHWEKVGAPVVNDLTTGGTDKALSAEMGKTLKEGLDALGPKIGQLENKTADISLVGTTDESDEIQINDDNDNYVAHIDGDGIHAKAIILQSSKNGSQTNLSTKIGELESEVDAAAAKTEPIEYAEDGASGEEFAIGSDDGTEKYFKVTQEGVFVKKLFDINGNEIEIDLSVGNVLYGKKYVAIGDSFTAGDYNGSTEQYTYTSGIFNGMNKVYPRMIALRNAMNLVMDAIAGTTMTNDVNSPYTSHNTYSFSNTRYQNIPTDADYITIWYGINDCASTEEAAAPLGTIADSSNNTFYGAWNVVLSWIVTNVPKAKIGIVVSNAIGSSTRGSDYRQAIRNVAEKYGIPILDLEQDKKIPYFLFQRERTGVAQSVRTSRDQQHAVVYGTNNHPNVVCHEFVSTIVENFLRTL